MFRVYLDSVISSFYYKESVAGSFQSCSTLRPTKTASRRGANEEQKSKDGRGAPADSSIPQGEPELTFKLAYYRCGCLNCMPGTPHHHRLNHLLKADRLTWISNWHSACCLRLFARESSNYVYIIITCCSYNSTHYFYFQRVEFTAFTQIKTKVNLSLCLSTIQLRHTEEYRLGSLFILGTT
jgi:hypothetical protein